MNTPGSWGDIYAPLSHAQWNGMTPTDMVFPTFMFIMGVSMYISLRKCGFSLDAALLKKIIRRTILIFLVGTAISLVAGFLFKLNYNVGQEGFSMGVLWRSVPEFSHLRILGVLQRLALCYGMGSLIVTLVKHRWLPYIIAALLAVYYVILALGNGFVYGPENILSVVDLNVLGVNHIYNDHSIDPEGVLSTIPALAHVLVGFCIGKLCVEYQQPEEKMSRIFLYSFIMLIVGLLLVDLCPLNKKVWSPTFVLVSCGLGGGLLAVLYWLIDLKGHNRLAVPFEVFGVNSLFCYVLSQILSVIFDTIPFGVSVHDGIYGGLCAAFGEGKFASMLYAVAFVLVVWAISYVLYKKKIYIKL